MKMELIEQVLSKADPSRENQIDRITFRNKTDRSRQESKIVRMRVLAQEGQGGQDRVRSKVNFQFVSKTTTSRPTGLPYIHANSPGDYNEENRNVKSYDQPAQLWQCHMFRPGPSTASRPSISRVQQTPADTRRYGERFPVRPAPVNGLGGSKPWRYHRGDGKRINYNRQLHKYHHLHQQLFKSFLLSQSEKSLSLQMQ